MMELVVATRNAGKLKEIRRLLESRGVGVLGLEGFPDAPDVVEDGDTFAENAIKKAEAVADLRISMSGRRFRPGGRGVAGGVIVFTRPGSSGAIVPMNPSNNRKLLDEMAAVPENQRQASFFCVMALCVQASRSGLLKAG